MTSSSIQSYSLSFPSRTSIPINALCPKLCLSARLQRTRLATKFLLVSCQVFPAASSHPCAFMQDLLRGSRVQSDQDMVLRSFPLSGLPLSPPHAHPLHPSPSACLPSPLPLCTSAAPSLSLCSHMAGVTCLGLLKGQNPRQGQSCPPQQAGSEKAIHLGLHALTGARRLKILHPSNFTLNTAQHLFCRYRENRFSVSKN